MGTYPNGGTPPSSLPVDANALHPVEHHIHQFAFTGGDVAGIVLIAVLVLVVGGMLWHTSRMRKASA